MFGKFMGGLILLIFALMSVASVASVAQVQGAQCAPWSNLSAYLTDTYGEAVTFQGQASATAVMQVWVNPATGTWTVIYMGADQSSCIAASGQGGEIIAPPPCWYGGLIA
jgi:hypothetical protein